MVNKFKYQYDSSTGILFKYYYGPITIEDIHSSWDYAINNNLIPKGTRSFVLDYTAASFDIKVKEHTKIAEYYRNHLEVFKNCKIAIITQTPKDVVIPALVETIDEGYYSKPFYTLEAAIDWVLK
ncbi:MAG: hypothetical protein IPJ23_07685 [Ignavibacteriales bacterium]|nr:hypothetical protein [Ignavibacteriales bacterium]